MVFRSADIKNIAKSTFFRFDFIGDRVFYYEFFQHKTLVYNSETTAYFRKEVSGLSNLENKNLKYLSKYTKTLSTPIE